MAMSECCGGVHVQALHESGILYIMKEDQTEEYYKVGVSGDLIKRHRNLQCGNWRKLIIMHTPKVSDMAEAEKYAHKKLKVYNWNKGGGTEWFKANFHTVKAAVDEAAKKYHRSDPEHRDTEEHEVLFK